MIVTLRNIVHQGMEFQKYLICLPLFFSKMMFGMSYQCNYNALVFYTILLYGVSLSVLMLYVYL